MKNSNFSSSRSLLRQSSQIPGWCDSGGWRWPLQSNFQSGFNLHWTTPSKNALPEVNVFDTEHCNLCSWYLPNERFIGEKEPENLISDLLRLISNLAKSLQRISPCHLWQLPSLQAAGKHKIKMNPSNLAFGLHCVSTHHSDVTRLSCAYQSQILISKST